MLFLVVVVSLVSGSLTGEEGCSDSFPSCQCHVEEDKNRTSCHCEESPELLRPSQNPINLTESLLFKWCENKTRVYKESVTDISIIRMTRLQYVERNFFEGMPKLKYIRIMHTSLTQIPHLKGLGEIDPMHIIDLESNKIRLISNNNVAVRVEQLFLDYNDIIRVDGWAFNGSEIGKLSFHGNRELNDLSENAFNGLKSLRDLDLSDTPISYLPVIGLEGLEVLRLQNTYKLKIIPSIYDLKRLETAWMTYSFHCCGFEFPAKHNPVRHQEYMDEITKLCNGEHERTIRSSKHGFGAILLQEEESFLPLVRADEALFSQRKSMKFQFEYNGSEDDGYFRLENGHSKMPGFSEEIFHETSAQLPTDKIHANCGNITKRSPVQCWPKPDPLNPCEDMMSWSWLRVSVWIVLSTAIFGNIAVLTVLSLSRSEKSVPRFLMINLAFADFCMAFYLLLLASMDLVSTEAYFNYAYDWQRGPGCKVAGFFTVFSSQLSLFTLCLLTVERWFAIRYALYTNRLDFHLATRIMVFGWLYALIMAILPLTGISSYSTTSICLPMDTHNIPSILYIMVLLISAALGFILICVCYTQIYLSLSYETRTSSSEGSVAHKMALLVATNFVCWAPIAFFSLTAVAGYPLINVTQSKILLVFIYPINSCANPYLYAILTKQYRRDFILLLARCGICTRCAQTYRMVYSRPTSNDIHAPALIIETAV